MAPRSRCLATEDRQGLDAGSAPASVSASASAWRRSRRSAVSVPAAAGVSASATGATAMGTPPKTKEACDFLAAALKRTVACAELDTEAMKFVIDACSRRHLAQGSRISEEEVVATPEGDKEKRTQVYHVIVVETGALRTELCGKAVRAGCVIGDLAVLHDRAWVASLVAETPCVVWSVDRVVVNAARRASAARRRAALDALLGRVQVVASFGPEERARLIDGLRLVNFDAHEVIVEQGAPRTALYVVLEGEAVATEDGILCARYGAGGCFGEEALLPNPPPPGGAGITAISRCRCAVLTPEAAERLVGPVVPAAAAAVAAPSAARPSAARPVAEAHDFYCDNAAAREARRKQVVKADAAGRGALAEPRKPSSGASHRGGGVAPTLLEAGARPLRWSSRADEAHDGKELRKSLERASGAKAVAAAASPRRSGGSPSPRRSCAGGGGQGSGRLSRPQSAISGGPATLSRSARKSLTLPGAALLGSRRRPPFIEWAFDEYGAYVATIHEESGPQGHCVKVGYGLLTINGADVVGLPKDEIKAIWMEASRHGYVDLEFDMTEETDS